MNGILDNDIVHLFLQPISVSFVRIPFLHSNDDLERMANGNISLLVHVSRSQPTIGVWYLDIEPERPRSWARPFHYQLRSSFLFSLSSVLEIFVDESIKRGLSRILFTKWEYRSVLAGVFQGK
jgi:hypothetical protein